MINEVASAQKVYNVAPPFLRVGFAEVGSGLVGGAADELTLVQTGPGMTVSQTGGNLTIATGVTANSETIIRSKNSLTGSLLARVKTILSQRIVNQIFRVELADVVDENLSFVINSATSVTVTFDKGNPFSDTNIGQSVRMSVIAGADGVPGRYAIASVAGNSVTFTVAGWPASGSGTLTLYGWNYIQLEYSGTTATNAFFDAQRRGWATGATTATINTTASPGHVAQLSYDVHTVGFSDALVASATTFQWAQRATRLENVPDPDIQLHLFIIAQNGSVAPASTTTWTLGFLQAEDQGRAKIRIASADPSTAHPLPVQLLGGTTAVTGTLTGITSAGTPAAPATPYILNSAATTNGALILTGTSGLHAFYATNIGATPAFVKLYNKATAPVVGTDVPAMILPVPAAVSGVPGVRDLPIGFSGFRFALGLGIAITGAVADTDTTAVAAGQVKVILSRTV